MGADVAELDLPALPDGVDAVWGAFKALSNARGQGNGGPAPLVFSEIEAYARLHGLALSSWELDTLQALDRVWLAACAARLKTGK